MRDEERVWLTYEEAGTALGIKAASAKRLSFRRHWPHRTGNDGLARVGVPVTELHRVTGDATGDVTGDNPHAIPGGDSGTVTGDTAALALALDRIEALAGQVGQARAEVERLRAEVAKAAHGQATAEATAADARHRAEEAERAALEGWRTAADVATRLAAVQRLAVPGRPLPASSRPKGFLARLLRW